ncbi:uncharacterized protein LOC128777086 [Panthera pardus]|uniref:Uncharacterized protein LOC128777086 n=1 Tax=Panthera pardus TaxID=9691 RepID=A0A9W2VIV0_PANPR|nr:uncharacterized protein LOC128777086 [Panthera pardus]
MCSLKEGVPETAEVAFLKGTRSWWSAFTPHAGPWGAHTEKGQQRVPPALPLLICLLRTGSLLLSLQIKRLLQGQKGRVVKRLYLAITRPQELGALTGRSAWSRVVVLPNPTVSEHSGFVSGKDQSHRRRAQSAHCQGEKGPRRLGVFKTGLRSVAQDVQLEPSLQCSGNVSPFVPRRAADSPETALHCQPSTCCPWRWAVGGRGAPRCAKSPTHFPWLEELVTFYIEMHLQEKTVSMRSSTLK